MNDGIIDKEIYQQHKTEVNVKVRLNRAKASLKDSLSGFYKKRIYFIFIFTGVTGLFFMYETNLSL
jgi:hypothetical protein